MSPLITISIMDDIESNFVHVLMFCSLTNLQNDLQIRKMFSNHKQCLAISNARVSQTFLGFFHWQTTVQPLRTDKRFSAFVRGDTNMHNQSFHYPLDHKVIGFLCFRTSISRPMNIKSSPNPPESGVPPYKYFPHYQREMVQILFLNGYL